MKKWSLNQLFWATLSLLFWVFLSLGQLQRWQLTPGIAIYAHDFLVMIGLLAYAIQHRNLVTSLPNPEFRKYRLEILFGLWIWFGWLIAALSQDNVVVALLYTARLFSYTGFTWAALSAPFWQKLPSQILGVKPQLIGYWSAGLTILYLGFMQYFLLPDTRALGLIGWDNHYYRLIGTQLDPGFTGMLLVLTLLLTFQLKFPKPIWQAVITALLTLAVALTYSRASYLAFGLGIVVYAAIAWWRDQEVRPKLLLVVLLAGLLVLLPRKGGEGVNLGRTSTITARVSSNQGSLLQLQPSQWLTGRGLLVPETIESQNTLRPDMAKIPDNLVVLIVTHLGLGGTVLLILLLAKHRQRLLNLPTLSLSSLAAILIHAQFNNTLLQPFVFLFIVGIMLSERLKKTKI